MSDSETEQKRQRIAQLFAEIAAEIAGEKRPLPIRVKLREPKPLIPKQYLQHSGEVDVEPDYDPELEGEDVAPIEYDFEPDYEEEAEHKEYLKMMKKLKKAFSKNVFINKQLSAYELKIVDLERKMKKLLEEREKLKEEKDKIDAKYTEKKRKKLELLKVKYNKNYSAIKNIREQIRFNKNKLVSGGRLLLHRHVSRRR